MRSSGWAAISKRLLPSSPGLFPNWLPCRTPVSWPNQPFMRAGPWAPRTSQTLSTALDQLLSIEQAHGRERLRRWGPRTLDLDLLLFGDRALDDERLTVPHRELPNRDFALQPLLDLNPGLTLPDGTPVATLRRQCPDNRLRKLPPADYP